MNKPDKLTEIVRRHADALYRSRNWPNAEGYREKFRLACNEYGTALTEELVRELTELRKACGEKPPAASRLKP